MQPTTRTRHASSIHRGFALTDAAVLLAGIALAGTLALPTLSAWRTDARLAGSRDNLRQLGQAHAAYASANSGFIATFDWEPEIVGNCPFDCEIREREIGCGAAVVQDTTVGTAQLQLAAILRRTTGRCGEAPSSETIAPNLDWVPHRRFGHLVLLDWMGASPTDPVSVSPLDAHQLEFQALTTPETYPGLPGGDADSSYAYFRDERSIKLWPYASSYQMTTYAYSASRPDDSGRLSQWPGSDATFQFGNDGNRFRRQNHQSVRFPSNKSLLFEEFDYSQGLGNQGRYYADPLASVNVLAFDGSARRVATADANPGWDPENFRLMDRTAELRYRSIDTRFFPDDSDRPDPYPGYHKWTRGGLEGIDFGAGEINTSDW
jgi:hypothetical protein